MSITRIQGTQNHSLSGIFTVTAALPAGAQFGNLLVAAYAMGANASEITPPDASWTRVAFNQPAGASATIETAIYYLVVDLAHAGQSSFTWTVVGTVHTQYICVEEWNSTYGWPAIPVDQTALGDTIAVPVTSTVIDSGTTAATIQPEELWIAALAYKGSAQAETLITPGWTKDLEATLSANNTLTMLYNVASSMGSADCNYTIGTAAFWAGSVATFRPAPPASRLPGWAQRPRYVMRAIAGSLFTPFQSRPAWVDRTLSSNFVRQIAPVNIPRYVRRGLSGLLANYAPDIATRFKLKRSPPAPLGPDFSSSWALVFSDEFDDTPGMSGPTNGLAAARWNSGAFNGPISPGVGAIGGITDPATTSGVINYNGPASIVFPGDDAVHLRLQNGVDNGGTFNTRTVESGQITTAGLFNINPQGIPVSTSSPDLRPYTVNGPSVLEFRIRIAGPNASAAAYWPVVWMLNAGQYFSGNPDGATWPGGHYGYSGLGSEIDLVEMFSGGTHGSDSVFTFHGNVEYNAGVGSGIPASLQSTDLSVDYHTYTYQFNASTINIWVDGQLVTNVTPTEAQVAAQGVNPLYLLFTFMAKTGAVLPTTTADIPNDFIIDYVRVWALKKGVSVPPPAWVDRALGSNFVRYTSPTNIPRYVRRGLSSLLSNYALNISTRLRLGILKDISTRLILGIGGTQSVRDIAARLRLGLVRDISARLRLGLVRDIAARFRLRSADQLKDIAARFRLGSLRDVASRLRLGLLRDVTTRFRLKSADQLRDIPARLRLGSLRDIASRLRLGLLKDVQTRFRLKSADQLRDIATRLRLGLLRDVASRFRLASLRDISTRFKLATANQSIRDVATRLRLRSANQLKDVASRLRLGLLRDIQTRFRLAQQRVDDVATRFRLISANQLKDLATRFRLMSASQLRDVTFRLRLAKLKDISTRFRLASISQSVRDISTRLRLMSAILTRDIASRFRLARVRDVPCRFVLGTASGSAVFQFTSVVLPRMLVSSTIASKINTISSRLQSLPLIGRVVAALSSTETLKPSLSFTRIGVMMPAPFTTIQSTITVTDVTGTLVSNASIVTLTITYPDQTTTALTMAGGGITNLGSGQYQAKYNTKMSGPTREVWNVTAVDGVTIGSYQFEVGVGY